MDPKKIKKTVIFVCVIFTVALSALAYRQYIDYVRLKEKEKAQQDELVAVKAEIRQIEESLKLYEKEKEDFQQYLFSERDVPAFLEEISKHAQQSVVNVVDMKTRKFQEVKVPEDLTAQSKMGKKQKSQTQAQDSKADVNRVFTLAAMSITVKVEGVYSALIKFLGALEEYKQLITISNLEIVSGRYYPTLQCGFTLKIYSLKTLEELQQK